MNRLIKSVLLILGIAGINAYAVVDVLRLMRDSRQWEAMPFNATLLAVQMGLFGGLLLSYLFITPVFKTPEKSRGRQLSVVVLAFLTAFLACIVSAYEFVSMLYISALCRYTEQKSYCSDLTLTTTHMRPKIFAILLVCRMIGTAVGAMHTLQAGSFFFVKKKTPTTKKELKKKAS
jgi:uncharacterized protein YacL